MSIPQTIGGRYRIESPIGSGAMGEVYLAQDALSGTQVAVKSLRPEILARQPDMVGRFVREGEALRRLNHPNIVKMLDSVHEGSAHYLVMEYVPGGDLHNLIADKKQLPLPRILSIALELADALSRAHHLHIIHRDVKPANVLLAEDGTPKLTDFGIAHHGDQPAMTGTGEVIGTYAYLAPEIFMSESPSEASDIWSFGVIIYEMLTGDKPFRGETPAGVMAAILMHPLPDPVEHRSDIPDGLLDLLYRMLAKTPRDRLSSARAVGAELESMTKGVDSTPTRPFTLSGSSSVLIPVRVRPTFGDATPTPSAITDAVLPRQTTPFIGREREVKEVGEMLTRPTCNLVTLLGPGGMGKTRLSIEAAARARTDFPNGVYFTPLAPLTAPEQVISAIAEALGMRFGDGSSSEEQLLTYLEEKSLLLVLDNFEHVLEAASLVDKMIRRADGVRLIVSSRARLNIGAECIYELEGMAIPKEESDQSFEEQDAVKLFMTYARRAQPGYGLSEDDKPAIRRICQMVEGAPLGLELAAAWARSLPPAEIAEELAGSLDFLESDRPDLPARQQGMRAAFDYSWAIIGERDQESLRRLSVFRGGFTRVEAKNIAKASVQSLSALVDHSFLHREPNGRYSVLEMVRQYAAEKLAGLPEQERVTRDAHSANYAAFLKSQIKALTGGDQAQALEEIEDEFDNIRAAWEWASETRRYDDLDGMVFNLMRFLMLRGRFQECDDLFRKAAESLEGDLDAPAKRLQGIMITRRGVIATHLSQYKEAREYLEKALEMAKERSDENDIAFATQELGNATAILGESENGRTLVEESIERFKKLSDPGSVARGLYRLGFVLAGMGRIEEGITATEECLKISREINDTYRMAGALSNLGSWYLFHGQYQKGYEYRQEGLELWRKMGNSSHMAHSLSILAGLSALMTGDPNPTRPMVEEGLTLSSDVASRAAVTYVRCWLASFDENFEEALVLGKTAMDLADQSGNFASVMHSNNVTGIALCGLGRHNKAAPHFIKALGIATAVRSPAFQTMILPSFAILKANEGDYESVVKILALTSTHAMSPKGWVKTFPLIKKAHDEAQLKLSDKAFESAWVKGEKTDIAEMISGLLPPPTPAT